MKHHVYVGTYHKTGTVWMQKVFRAMARRLDVLTFKNISQSILPWKDEAELVGIMSETIAGAEAAGGKAVFFQSHSKLPSEGFEELRGFRVVRDPRDLILSAARYHVRAAEPWLHRPNARFDGKTYSEAINACATFEDQVRFEMDNAGGRIIRNMAAFPRPEAIVAVKYEDLIVDEETECFGGLLEAAGFDPREVKAGRKAFWAQSLFGGMKEKRPKHVTNGAAEQWRTQFPDTLIDPFHDEFGDQLAVLGYAT